MVGIIALRPGYQYPTRLCQSRYRVQATDVSPGEGGTDLVHEVSGTLSKGDDSRMGGQDSCVPAKITKGGNSHECVRGRAERMPADACI